jgi:hypothetical protein
LKKDKREGRIKHNTYDTNSKNKELFKKLDPFNMKCLITDDHKSKVQKAKIKLLSNHALHAHHPQIRRKRSNSLHQIKKCDLPRCPFTKHYRKHREREMSLRKGTDKCCDHQNKNKKPEQKYLNDDYDI